MSKTETKLTDAVLGADAVPTNRERALRGDVFLSITGRALKIENSDRDSYTLSMDGNYFANVVNINKSSFSYFTYGFNKKLSETVEFHKLNFKTKL